MAGNWNSGEWCYFRSYLGKDTCEKIINDALQIPPQDAVVGINGINVALDTSIRRSKVRFIQRTDPTFEWLFDEMWKMAIEANDLWFGFHISKITYIQLAEYDESYQGHYDKHHDVFWMNNDPQYHRKLTCVVQLTDPNEYEGGNLVLFNQNQKIDAEAIKQQGTVIFFPSFIEHQAEKVTKGKRYSK